MNYKNLTVTPKSLIDPDITLGTPEGLAQLNMITIRVELTLRPIEFMALVDICGSRNVQLKQKRKTSLVEMDNDMGNIIRDKYIQDERAYEKLRIPPVIGLWEYDCVAYFRGRSIYSLVAGPTIRPLFPETGVIDEEEIMMRRLLPGLYNHIFNNWFIKSQVLSISDIPVYDVGVADNSATTRYISNGLYTMDCMNLSGNVVQALKRANTANYKSEQLTMVVRTRVIDFIDVFSEHPSCIEILAHDPFYDKLRNSIDGHIIDKEDAMLAANLIELNTQFMYVIRISFTETALDELSCCSWYKEDNAIFDEVHRLLYDLEIFK